MRIHQGDTEIVIAELLARIDSLRGELEREQVPSRVSYLQGQIAGLRRLKDWLAPQTVQLPEPAERRLSTPPNY
jgi:hypothetical protein